MGLKPALIASCASRLPSCGTILPPPLNSIEDKAGLWRAPDGDSVRVTGFSERRTRTAGRRKGYLFLAGDATTVAVIVLWESARVSFKSSDEDIGVKESLEKEELVADYSQRPCYTQLLCLYVPLIRIVYICESFGDLHMSIWKGSHSVVSVHLVIQLYEPLCSWHAKSLSLFLG